MANNDVLGPMDKLVLEGLEGKTDFIGAAEFVFCLGLKNEAMATVAVDAIAGLVNMGLIAANDTTKIKITPLGEETLNREGRLDEAAKSDLVMQPG
jgi:hypothetical protein